MTEKWEKFIDDLVDEAGDLAKDNFKEFVKTFSSDQKEFRKEQGKKLKEYLEQLAEKKINKDEFKSYITDMKDLAEAQKNLEAATAKKQTEDFLAGLQSYVIKGLFGLI